ncbi:MAG: DUF1553 domain-containing protein [Bryobacteraceae bacterium]
MLKFIAPLGLAFASFALAKPVDFDREVRPILSDHCFQCHGPDQAKRMAGLRLDTRDGAFAVRGTAPVIVAGKSGESRLYQRVSHAKTTMRMPPPTSGMNLTEAQIDTIKRWIDEGATWRTHWAYTAPVRPAEPVVKTKAWVRNPIDSFVLARLEREGLKPSPEAPKTTLIRRAAFDLTGLPPTREEVDAFLKDKSPDAYEKLVDRLLASPHYGERMAMQWLDLARYADTHGYHIDSHRDMWPWRDWVIRSFNNNLPFDQFTVWQLAGDLLPNPTRDQKIATGFNRNHMINFEGGAIPEEYQNEYMVDRIETTSNVWMSTTLGCAKCHDHKYDPIAQRDFYRFGAFFNNIPEKGLDGQTGNAEPFLLLPDDKQEKRLAELKAAVAERNEKLPDELVWALTTEWRKTKFDIVPQSPTAGLSAWYELDGNLSDTSGHFRNGRILKGEPVFNNGPVRRWPELDTSIQLQFPADAVALEKPFSMAFWFRVGRQPGITLMQKQDAASNFEIGLSKPMSLPGLKRGHDVEIRWTAGNGSLLVHTDGYPALQNELNHVVVESDGTGKAAGLHFYLNGKLLQLVTVKDALGQAAANSGPVAVGSVKLPMRGRIDDVRFYERTLAAEEAAQLALEYPVQVLLNTPGKRKGEQIELLEDYYLRHDASPELRTAYTELKTLVKEEGELVAAIPTTMVMEEKTDEPRDTYVLGRGDYTNRKEKVTPGVPAMLPPLPVGQPANRLALAKWLVDPSHPLTARVTVNRYWQMYFGYGLVKTSEDFGSQGEPPVNQELLDWLATEFIRTGWDVKATQRLILTSAAYRQSSKVTPALHERDPENRLLARGPRFRLPAEMVRDNALAVSGLLSAKTGGPSVLPYQPSGIWEELAFGEGFSAQEYVQGHGEDVYRRSMYTFWKRTVPPASLNTFDAPDREKCTSRRAVTNTPLQALVTLNDPTYIEAARNLAERVLEPAKVADDERLKTAFETVTARAPSKGELQVLRSTLKDQRAVYAGDAKAANELLHVGESPLPASVDAPTLAAWTNVCTVLLNLDEAITKE